MKKLMMSAAALMCGAAMFAQFNNSDVTQTGNGNSSLVTQIGLLNDSDVDQTGDNNTSDMDQFECCA